MLLEQCDLILEKRINPEIYFNAEALDSYRSDDVVRLSAALRAHGLSITMHAPFMDLSPGGVDSKIRHATSERLEQMLKVATIFKPLLIVFHSGYNKWFFDGNVDLWLQQSLITWRPLLAQAESAGIPIAFENVFEEEPLSLARLLVTLNSPLCGFCFDTGHFNLFSTVSMQEWFHSLGIYLKSVHLHDNLKTFDDHLPMGEGTIDFDLFFRLIREHRIDALFTVEPHKLEHVEPSIKACQRYVMNLK